MEVKFIETTKSNLDSLPIVNGQVIALNDYPGMYYDLNGHRFCVATIGSAGAVELDLLNPMELYTVDINTKTNLTYDGYISQRVVYNSTSGRSTLTIYDSYDNIMFTDEMCCGNKDDEDYIYSGALLPVKSGWSFEITGNKVESCGYKYTHC